VFLLNRYMMLIYFVLEYASWTCDPPKRSYILDQTVNSITIMVLYFLWAVFSALRIYATHGRDWRIPSIIMSLSLVPVATNIASDKS